MAFSDAWGRVRAIDDAVLDGAEAPANDRPAVGGGPDGEHALNALVTSLYYLHDEAVSLRLFAAAHVIGLAAELVPGRDDEGDLKRPQPGMSSLRTQKGSER